MKVIAPGSYDPVTLGHLDVIERASRKYDEVYAVVFINAEKEYFFTIEERRNMLALAVSHLENVRVDFSLGRVVDYMKENKIDRIVKGYRNARDMEYEKIQADYNFENGGFETELIKAKDSLSEISSTLAREKIKKKEELYGILPPKVIEFLKTRD